MIWLEHCLERLDKRRGGINAALTLPEPDALYDEVICIAEKRYENPPRLFEVCAHQINKIFGEFRGNLLFGAVDEMKANVVFKHLCHQSIDAAAYSGKQHELVATIGVTIDGTLYRIELAA